jgi:alpha-beta hydrolase superfamily lysophospholipase
MSSIQAADYIKQYPPIHTEWWKEHVRYIKFRRQGIDIIGAKFEQKTGNAVRANVIVITGWSECFLKYVEIIKMLFEQGFNVYTYDHQSQGERKPVVLNTLDQN